MKRQNEQMLQAHAQMYTLPQPFDQMMPPNRPMPGFDPEAPRFRLSVFYTVAISRDGKVLEIRNGAAAVYSDAALAQMAKEILARNFSDGHLLFPHHAVTTNTAALNKEIKRLFTICGITRMVTVRNPVTGADEQKPINEIASSHMARRTFIGNLYKKVKDPELICSMTGHTKGSRSFSRYREIDEDIKIELVNLIN